MTARKSRQRKIWRFYWRTLQGGPRHYRWQPMRPRPEKPRSLRGYNAAIHFIIAGVTLAEIGEREQLFGPLDQLKRATVMLSN